jgi:cyclopropane-fatty-acyl-phospholipid synthase
MDDNEKLIKPLFEQCYGQADAPIWWMRWRLFYMACAELFGFNGGKEWFVAHYRFHRAGCKADK